MAKILIIASYTPSLLNFRGPLMRELLSCGHEIVACSPAPSLSDLERLSELRIKHRSFPLQRTGLNPIRDWSTTRALNRIIRQEEPDHVLAYTVKPVVYGCFLAHRAGVPNVHALITGLGTAFQGTSLTRRSLNWVVSRLYQRALGGCTRVFFQNPDDRALFVTRGLVNPEKVTVVAGSGIDLDQFAMAEIPDGPPCFLLIARLIQEKGIREFAAAAHQIVRDYPGARFRLVGFLEDHPSAISQHELDRWVGDGSIEYCGSTDDVRPYLRDCTVFCLPSYYREGVPRSILEAMAVGRAIITTDTPGCRETVSEGHNGFLIPIRDPSALALAMREFCRQAHLARIMGEASRRLAERCFDVHNVNAALIEGMGLTVRS